MPGLTTKTTNDAKVTKNYLSFFVCLESFVHFVVAFLFVVHGYTAPLYAADRIPLIDAARNADTDALRALLKQAVDVNAAAADGTTALHWASYRDAVETADLLIRAGANVNAANDLGATPLWVASVNGSSAMVGRLLQAKADPNLALLLGETPLIIASRSGNPLVITQ